MVGDLQQTHGNAYVNQLLTPAVQRAGPKGAPAAPAPPPAWVVSFKPGRPQGAERKHEHSDSTDSLKLFPGDVLTVVAPTGASTGTPSVHSTRTFAEQTSPGPQPASSASQGNVQWAVDFEHVGEYKFAFDAGGGARRDVNVDVVLDERGFMDRCLLAHLDLDRQYKAIHEGLGKAANEYSNAYDAHEKDLKDADREERIPADILEGLFFAAVGGAAGGAVGELLKGPATTLVKGTVGDLLSRWAGEAAGKAHAAAAAAVSDLGKDMVKYAFRSIPKIAGSYGSSPDTSGDAQAQASGELPGSSGGGRDSAVLEKPFLWMNRLQSSLDGESTHVLGDLLNLGKGVVHASDRGATEFAVDPLELAENNHDMEKVAAGLPIDKKFYLRLLWHAWIDQYYWLVIFDPAPLTPTDPKLKKKGPWEISFTNKVRGKIMRVAADCGENGQDWINAVKDKAQAEADKRNREYWQSH